MRWEDYVRLVTAGGAPYVGYPNVAPPAGSGITGYSGVGAAVAPTTKLTPTSEANDWFSVSTMEQAIQDFLALTSGEKYEVGIAQGLTPAQLAQQGLYPSEPVVEPLVELLEEPYGEDYPATLSPITAEAAPFIETGGMLTAGMSEYETQALQMLSDLAGQLGGMASPWESPMGQQVGTALSSLLSGEFPEEYFQTSIEAPARKRFEEVTLPGVREAFVGPGTFWGGERAGAEAEAGTDLDAALAAIRGDLGYRARGQALSAVSPGMEFMGMPADQLLQQMAGTSSFVGAGALPRLIEQHGLDVAYQEFIRTRPENQPYAEMLLSLLGIPMLASYAPETPENPLAPILELFGTFLPLLIGA